MGWIDITTDRGTHWQVNQDGLYLMARASARAALARRYTSERRSGEGWFDGPVLVEIHTDWGRVNRETDRTASDLYNTLARETMINPENSVRNFAHIVAETRLNQTYLRELQQRTMSGNMANINRHVNNWENAIAVTRFIRDAAWTTLVVLAAVPTGGASAAGGGGALAMSSGMRVTALGLGSIGRGQATYQDTGNVGAAMVSGSGTFITGAIGLPPGPGAALSSGNQAILLGVQTTSAGGFAGLQSLVEGKSGETAAWQAVSAAGFNLAGGLMSGTQVFENMSVPVQLTVQIGADMAGNAVGNAIGDAGTASPPPRTSGRLTFGGVPPQQSRDAAHVRDTVLRPQ